MSEYEVQCPMPECTEILTIVYMTSYTLSPYDLSGSQGVKADEAHSLTWKVECLAGHVILVPTERPGCACPDPGDEDCNVMLHFDDYDWSEESRTFREHDMVRLRDIIAKLSA